MNTATNALRTDTNTIPAPHHSPGTTWEKKVAAIEHFNHALYQEISIDEFSHQALDSACQIIGGQAGSLLLVTHEPQKLEFKLSKGPNPVPTGTAIFRNLGIAGHVFLSGQPAIVLDAGNDPRHWSGIDQLTGYTTKNMIAAPIKRLDGELLGVIEVLNKSNGTPNQEDVMILQILSSFLSIAFHKSWLEKSQQTAPFTHFIGNCVHDMKNMLMTIFTCKELLREEIDHLYELKMSEGSTSHLASLKLCKEILDMMDVNTLRIQKEAKELVDCLMKRESSLEITTCQIHPIVTAAVEILSCQIRQKNVKVEMDGLESLPTIEGDERKLFSIFYNILQNAVTAIQHEGTIRIHGRMEQKIHLLFQDDGPGIPEHKLEGLFSHKQTSQKAMGNSYGLRSARNAVEDHGGTLKIESAVGVGTTMHIWLPIDSLPPAIQTKKENSHFG